MANFEERFKNVTQKGVIGVKVPQEMATSRELLHAHSRAPLNVPTPVIYVPTSRNINIPSTTALLTIPIQKGLYVFSNDAFLACNADPFQCACLNGY